MDSDGNDHIFPNIFSGKRSHGKAIRKNVFFVQKMGFSHLPSGYDCHIAIENGDL